ncbi:MAG TPA: cytochrome C551 [Clostridiaceae bacterium]|jgi:ssDNA-binding Zn-finger/Zn-ribbon topoisomerase 1|nr:cytochrome C551 [Clostridiaceae bacterium]
MEDKTLQCKDCGAEFIFTAGEQEFYKEKGFENEPQRCPECRRARKLARSQNRGPRY